MSLSPIRHHFVIDPAVGVGPIRFGMHKDEVARAFTYVYSSFFKSDQSKVRSDHCEYVGLIIHYDDDGFVTYIEVTAPDYVEVTLELFETDVTRISMRNAVALLSSKSARFTKDTYGYDFPDLGINLYSDNYGDEGYSEDESVQCIGVSHRP